MVAVNGLPLYRETVRLDKLPGTGQDRPDGLGRMEGTRMEEGFDGMFLAVAGDGEKASISFYGTKEFLEYCLILVGSLVDSILNDEDSETDRE
ncbi:MAG: hypothetical protein M0Z41_16045 [Peptococcaceae bacterium]|jgi:hypothetical protein|nr:hypothetical protein [Peptococcaceae bacterium]